MSAFSESTGYKLGIVNHSPVSICVTSVHLRSTLFIWLGAVCLTGADGSAPAWAVLVARFDSPAVDGVPTGHMSDPGLDGILAGGNQNFQEDGIHVEGWWAGTKPRSDGTIDSIYFTDTNNGGHLHDVGPPDLLGYERSHGWDRHVDSVNGETVPDISGIYIQLVSGGAFNLDSLDWDLLGTSLRETEIWISSTFDPTLFDPIMYDPDADDDPTKNWASQFEKYSVSEPPIDPNPDVFSILSFTSVSSLQNITQVFIAANLGASISNLILYDNITVTAVPEASQLIVWSLLTAISGVIAIWTRSKVAD